MAPPDVKFNIYFVRRFLHPRVCQSIIDELSTAKHEPATVYGGPEPNAVDDSIRKTIRLIPSSKTLELIRTHLVETREQISSHFGVKLQRIETPQFLRYSAGDFFVAHQDGNTGLLLSKREQFRKISVVLFLNDQTETQQPDSFTGGSLVFTEWRPQRNRGQQTLVPERGMLVAFESETTHEVTPVTSGERYSIVSWYG